jgi:hypothetical protein
MPKSEVLIALMLVVGGSLCACTSPKPVEAVKPLTARQIGADGSPVEDAPEPEVVQLKKLEVIGEKKYVTVGNVAGDYVLMCEESANDSKSYMIPSCLAPIPQSNYLLFKTDTKWLMKDAKEPMTLKFLEDFSVSYNNAQNIGLVSAHKSSESYGVYKLISWTASTK